MDKRTCDTFTLINISGRCCCCDWFRRRRRWWWCWNM